MKREITDLREKVEEKKKKLEEIKPLVAKMHYQFEQAKKEITP